jgi:hypothetical protein
VLRLIARVLTISVASLVATCGGKIESASTTGSTGGTGNGGSAAANGNGGSAATLPNDGHYPRVTYDGGYGYETSCPAFWNAWGMSCWHFDGSQSTSCYEPTRSCNVCLCAIPCDDPGDAACPPGLTGAATPTCIHETPSSVGSCFLTCDMSGPCPDGMACVPYPPDVTRSVCMWLRR